MTHLVGRREEVVGRREEAVGREKEVEARVRFRLPGTHNWWRASQRNQYRLPALGMNTSRAALHLRSALLSVELWEGSGVIIASWRIVEEPPCLNSFAQLGDLNALTAAPFVISIYV